MKRTAIRFGMAALVAAGLVSSAPSIGSTASATSGRGAGIQVAGTCSASSTSNLKAKHDNGQIEVEWQVDSNVVGQTWNVALADNGTIFFKGKRVTQAPSGSFTVRKFTANQPGVDKITARAKNPATLELCTAKLGI
jgi:DUF4097 and DUF4098 domain-containing protein YvlB